MPCVELIEGTKAIIRRWVIEMSRPAALLSFGKDSMVLAHLIRSAVHRDDLNFPSVHDFPIPVIYHRDPWFPHKNMFAEQIARSWSMEVHDFAPLAAGVKVNNNTLELVARYNFGTTAMDIPKNVCSPEEYPRRDYICGLNDWLMRPKTAMMQYPFDCIFHGHKSCDVDQFEGPVPLKVGNVQIGGVSVVFPLKDWSDKDVWDYIDQEHIPVQTARYRRRSEVADKWPNNDYIHACTRCIDPRNDESMVMCPKLNRPTRNRGKEVLQLKFEPDYVER